MRRLCSDLGPIKSGDGKGGNYKKKENIQSAEEKKKQRKKRMKMFGEGKYFQRKKRLRFLLSEMYLLSNLLGFVND